MNTPAPTPFRYKLIFISLGLEFLMPLMDLFGAYQLQQNPQGMSSAAQHSLQFFTIKSFAFLFLSLFCFFLFLKKHPWSREATIALFALSGIKSLLALGIDGFVLFSGVQTTPLATTLLIAQPLLGFAFAVYLIKVLLHPTWRGYFK